MDEPIRVLFVCVHNSARSQMAETFLHALGRGRFHAESGGFEPRTIQPLVVEVMRELGFDLSGRQAHSLFTYFKEGRLYDYVITVCDESVDEQCPVFPGVQKRLHWPFPDPGKVTGTRDEQLRGVRDIRDRIRTRIAAWVASLE
jgi:arsenate reductase